MSKSYFVYILSSTTGTLYVGMTNDLSRRIYEHKNKLVPGFTSKYNVNRLVYYWEFYDVNEAIDSEKRLKKWSRAKKLSLIKTVNPNFKDINLEISHPSDSR